MKKDLKDLILRILDENRVMAIATVRPDGWPQATMVSYVHAGLVLYTFIGRHGQKAENIRKDARTSLTLGRDSHRPLDTKGLSMAANGLLVDDKAEVDHAYGLLLQKFPEYKVMPKPDPKETVLLRLTPDWISVVDYEKGFGHADLVKVSGTDLADFVEAHRHHWAGQR
jgi:general stress protein 26